MYLNSIYSTKAASLNSTIKPNIACRTTCPVSTASISSSTTWKRATSHPSPATCVHPESSSTRLDAHSTLPLPLARKKSQTSSSSVRRNAELLHCMSISVSMGWQSKVCVERLTALIGAGTARSAPLMSSINGIPGSTMLQLWRSIHRCSRGRAHHLIYSIGE